MKYLSILALIPFGYSLDSKGIRQQIVFGKNTTEHELFKRGHHEESSMLNIFETSASDYYCTDPYYPSGKKYRFNSDPWGGGKVLLT